MIEKHTEFHDDYWEGEGSFTNFSTYYFNHHNQLVKIETITVRYDKNHQYVSESFSEYTQHNISRHQREFAVQLI